MLGTNAVASYENLLLNAIKSFLTLATGVDVMKLFSLLLAKRIIKLERLFQASLSGIV